MRNNVFGKTLMFAIHVGKTDGATFYLALIYGILHKEFRHQFATGIAGALAVLCCWHHQIIAFANATILVPGLHWIHLTGWTVDEGVSLDTDGLFQERLHGNHIGLPSVLYLVKVFCMYYCSTIDINRSVVSTLLTQNLRLNSLHLVCIIDVVFIEHESGVVKIRFYSIYWTCKEVIKANDTAILLSL